MSCSLIVPFMATRSTMIWTLSDMTCIVQNVINVKLTNSLHANRHCKRINKELITSVGYGEKLWHPWLIYQILLSTNGKLEMSGHLRLIGWIVNQHLIFLNEKSQCNWRWRMIILIVLLKKIPDFSRVVNCIVCAQLHIKTCYVVGEFS